MFYRELRKVRSADRDHRLIRVAKMSDATINWTDLREFRAVDLTRSFILSWKMEADSLLIDLDLSLKEYQEN